MQNQCPKGKGKGGKGKGKDTKGKAQCHKCWGCHVAANCPSQSLNSFEAGSEQQQGDDTWWWSATDDQQWWATPAQSEQATGAGGTFAAPGATQTPQTLNALNLNTLTLEGLSLHSFGSLVLKLKVDSAAGASVVPVGASQEPVQRDDKTGRVYYTASGEKL
eukprot:4161049-Amphidinium_carterae.3